MIIVIADDLSGAAELAGAALRHGLSAEVQTSFFPGTSAEVVCIDTDTRLLPAAEAARRVAATARSALAANPSWIFKKCDSVLRGPVLAEARAVAEVTGRHRILLIPANPSRGRTIRDGKYYIAGQPLHATSFATDPAHPRLTSDVRELLDEALPGIEVPDINSAADIDLMVAGIDANTLPVGAADFFSAVLAARKQPKPAAPSHPAAGGKTLLVCGSAATWNGRSAEAKASGIPTFALPCEPAAVVSAIRANECVLIGVGDGPATKNSVAAVLTGQLAQTVAAVVTQTRLARLLLEGGATSAAVIAALGWTRLRAELAAGSGIGVMRPVALQAPLLFIKPGSYAWPAGVWP